MITEEKKIEKTCSFYASDYHLEMIMIPYINKKIDEETNIAIITERSLKNTAKEVVEKINLTQERKTKILNVDWENNNLDKIKNKENQTIFVIGNIDYIKNINKEIESKYSNKITKIINCYSLEDAQENATEIATKHTKVLNTKEEKEIEKNY